MVTFSFDAAVSANTTLGYTPGALEGEAASATLRLYAGAFGADDAAVLAGTHEHSVSVMYQDGDVPGGASDSWSGLMSASFSNLGHQSGRGEFWAEASIGGRSVISAVPEPGAWGMLLAGLGLLGVVARRASAQANRCLSRRMS
ncbi:PEP-CTERM sorting domain-containing protein [Duganella radicis]|uniref:PEP-CTERM sorting domain-containing protein n=2 Tax=Duganella radicis TaxID=551988 RepID=A0A6L6PH03_9BURK|nr:PEP-CTERM sorting domain-containing protein [Duganella radicis]